MNYDLKVVKKLEGWAASNPTPDKPLLIVGRAAYSPNKIVEEIKAQTSLGLRLYQAFLRDGAPKA